MPKGAGYEDRWGLFLFFIINLVKGGSKSIIVSH